MPSSPVTPEESPVLEPTVAAPTPVAVETPEPEARIHLHAWADGLAKAGRVELIEVYIGLQERLGHVYDTATTYSAELEAFANARV